MLANGMNDPVGGGEERGGRLAAHEGRVVVSGVAAIVVKLAPQTIEDQDGIADGGVGRLTAKLDGGIGGGGVERVEVVEETVDAPALAGALAGLAELGIGAAKSFIAAIERKRQL